MDWQGRSFFLSEMDSMGTTKSKSAHKTRIKPHSPILGVLYPMGSFLLNYVMLLPVSREQS